MLHRTAVVLLALSTGLAAQTKQGSPAAKKAPGQAAPPSAIIHTTAGDMKCQLFPDKAPKTVASFIGLSKGTKAWKDPEGKNVRGKPLYDGVIFHRVIPGFMIQGGDPSAGHDADIGFELQDELHPDLLFDVPGRLAMANRGPNTAGSQFFVTEVAVPFLNPCYTDGGCMRGNRPVAKNTGYTIFGQCDDAAVELVKKIAQGPCQAGPCNPSNSRPQSPVKITHIEIAGGASSAPKPSTRQPGATGAASPKPSPAASPGK